MKIRKGDTVKVIAGVDKGATGKVIHVDLDRDRVVVEKVRLIKRHQKPTQQLPQGGIVEKEASIHVSNVMLLDPKSGDPTRVGTKKLDNGKRERVAKRSGEIIQRSE